MSLARIAPREIAALAAALALALTLHASPAAGGGINLSWDACGSSGVAQRNFACNTNSGIDILYVSAIPTFAMVALNGHEGVLTVTTLQATLPNWWQRQTGGCRAPGPFTSVDFQTDPTTCRDVWEGQAVAGQIFDYPVSGYGLDRARIRTVSALPAGIEQSVNATDELYILKLLMTRTKSTGIGACAGCTESACIVLQSIKLVGPMGSPTQTISNPLLRQHVIWQDAAPLAGCPGATSTRNPTWGSVKSLYR